MLYRWPTGSDSHSPEHCFSPSPGQPLPWWPVQILSTRWVFPTSATKDNNSFLSSRLLKKRISFFTQKTHCHWCYRVHSYICKVKKRMPFSSSAQTMDPTLVYPLTAHHLIWWLSRCCVSSSSTVSSYLKVTAVVRCGLFTPPSFRGALSSVAVTS